jgi:dTDP-glucose 4,6-dehydratase
MQTLTGTKVLVTGAAGFIGSHLVEALIGGGADVRALLRYDSQNRLGNLAHLNEDDLAKIEIVRGDLKDPEAVRAAVSGCRIVFHLGALIGIPYSYQNPTDYVQTNVVGSLHVLNACRELGVARVIQTSTSEVYGTAQFTPITLLHPRSGQSPYAASKIAADALAESYACAFDLPVVILRPFNTYGPRQSPRAVIPTIVQQALSGNTIRLGNTDTTRDFLYVADTVAGFIAAATTRDLPHGIELHLGTGVATAIADVVQVVGALLERPLDVVFDEKRVRPAASEVETLLCDASVARDSLAWSPQISLRDGVASVIAAMRNTAQSDIPQEIFNYTT